MLGAQPLLLRGQALPEQRLRFPVAAQADVDRGQVARILRGGQRGWLQRAALGMDGLHLRQGLRVLAGAHQRHAQPGTLQPCLRMLFAMLLDGFAYVAARGVNGLADPPLIQQFQHRALAGGSRRARLLGPGGACAKAGQGACQHDQACQRGCCERLPLRHLTLLLM